MKRKSLCRRTASVLSLLAFLLALAPLPAHADETKVFVNVYAYTPNSGQADACKVDPLIETCENVHITADSSIRSAFDAAMPSVVGHNTVIKGQWTNQAAGEFTVTRVPVPQT